MAIQLAGRGAIAVSFDDGFAELASVDRAGFPRIDVTDRSVSGVIGFAEADLASQMLPAEARANPGATKRGRVMSDKRSSNLARPRRTPA
jgi:hypothetical protein